MKLTLKTGSAIGAFVAAMALSPLASALTMTFDNASGTYVGDNGLVGVATTNANGTLYYSASGLGRNGGGITQNNSITVMFNQRILLDKIDLNDWSIGNFFTAGDTGTLSYIPTVPAQTLNTTGSPSGTFSTGGVSIDGFVITGGPKSGTGLFGGSTNFRLNNIEYSETPVPATLWLFGSALMGLGLVKRRKTA